MEPLQVGCHVDEQPARVLDEGPLQAPQLRDRVLQLRIGTSPAGRVDRRGRRRRRGVVGQLLRHGRQQVLLTYHAHCPVIRACVEPIWSNISFLNRSIIK